MSIRLGRGNLTYKSGLVKILSGLVTISDTLARQLVNFSPKSDPWQDNLNIIICSYLVIMVHSDSHTFTGSCTEGIFSAMLVQHDKNNLLYYVLHNIIQYYASILQILHFFKCKLTAEGYSTLTLYMP